MDNNERYERYQRQILLKEFGEAGQQKLLDAKVLVIGAGGLGCPVLQYLAAAGLGTIGIVDDDVVSITNLHRQILYGMNDVGLPKAERATAVLKNLNPDINIIPYPLRITNQNALGFIHEYDIVVDGSDNFSTRYMINDACVILKKPLVYAAISRFEGQVAVFNYHRSGEERPANYRDLFPIPPADNEVLNCAEAGVLGVLPGIIGSMQANEAIKLITGIGKPLVDQLLTYNALNNQVYVLDLSVSNDGLLDIPVDEDAFKSTNYDWSCSTASIPEIDAETFDSLRSSSNVTIIDVREPGEQPLMNEFHHLKYPLSSFRNSDLKVSEDAVITFCQSGKRSMQAAQILFDTFGRSKKIYSLKGGIVAWKKHQQKL